MKRFQSSCLLAVMLLFARSGFAQTPAGGLTPAQMNAKAKAQNVPEIAFDSVPNFLKLPPMCSSARHRCRDQLQGTHFCLHPKPEHPPV